MTMKPLVKFAITWVFALTCFTGLAQDAPDQDSPPLRFSEEMPEFPGGADSLTAFLQREIVYPPIAKKYGITGTVLIEFVVERDGRVTHGKVKVPLFPDCDVEALRVVMSMPRWKPGKNLGKPIRCFYMVPVRFEVGS